MNELPSNKQSWFHFSIGGLLVSLAGFIFLCNNSKIVSWNVWLLLVQFWPVLLIISGLTLLTKRNSRGRIFMNTVSTFILVILVCFAIASTDQRIDTRLSQAIPQWKMLSDRFIGDTQEKTREVIINDQQFESAEKRTLSINFGSGELDLHDDDSDNFAKVNGTYYNIAAEPRVTAAMNNATVLITVDHGFEIGKINPLLKDKRYSVVLGRPQLTTDISVRVGSGTGTVSVSALLLNSAQFEVGSGALTIDLSNSTSLPNQLDINVGSGSATVSIAQGIGIMSTIQKGSGTVTIDKTNIDDENEYKTPSYSTAEQKVTLNLRVGSGNIAIRYL
ncbi:DUF4097 family beta strand repeat protein [candidate division WWE3 bacterium]|nr:DUF4097 family beta strand repeat protein [candidate division WWE3 bacterium]